MPHPNNRDLFPETVVRRPLPELIIRKAEISDCGQCRWTLTRTWWAGPHVCFIGLNSSTADGLKDDPTVFRWIRLAYGWGYGGFVGVNLYPFRSPHPSDMRRWAAWESNGPDYAARDAIWKNQNVVIREAKAAAIIVACWGAGADWNLDAEMHMENTVEQIVTGVEPWPDTIYCLGKTASGAPIHPMARGKNRVPDDAKPIPWRTFK